MSGDWNRRIGYRIYNITYKSHQSTERQTFTCQMPRNPFHIEGQPNFRSLQVLEGQCEFKSFNVSWKHVRSTGPDAYCYAVFNAIKRPSCLSSQSRILSSTRKRDWSPIQGNSWCLKWTSLHIPPQPSCREGTHNSSGCIRGKIIPSSATQQPYKLLRKKHRNCPAAPMTISLLNKWKHMRWKTPSWSSKWHSRLTPYSNFIDDLQNWLSMLSCQSRPINPPALPTFPSQRTLSYCGIWYPRIAVLLRNVDDPTWKSIFAKQNKTHFHFQSPIKCTIKVLLQIHTHQCCWCITPPSVDYKARRLSILKA